MISVSEGETEVYVHSAGRSEINLYEYHNIDNCSHSIGRRNILIDLFVLLQHGARIHTVFIYRKTIKLVGSDRLTIIQCECLSRVNFSFFTLRPFVCWLLCEQDYTKITNWISTTWASTQNRPY